MQGSFLSGFGSARVDPDLGCSGETVSVARGFGFILVLAMVRFLPAVACTTPQFQVCRAADGLHLSVLSTAALMAVRSCVGTGTSVASVIIFAWVLSARIGNVPSVLVLADPPPYPKP